MSENRLKDELTTQSLVIKSIWNNADSKYTNSWSSVLEQFPQNLYSFVIRYLNNTLANGTNAVKWGITKDSSCKFCTNTQTLGHVIGGCSVALVEKRYKWRHDINGGMTQYYSTLPNFCAHFRNWMFIVISTSILKIHR